MRKTSFYIARFCDTLLFRSQLPDAFRRTIEASFIGWE